ncbi:hypothetical protein MBLNU13_g01174t1 [Cladosporium sp. NU13]
MRFFQAIGLLAFAGAALAAPTGSERRVARMARRATGNKHNRPMAPNTQNIADIIEIPVNTTHVQYSSNWAGAVIISSGITSVTGTFIVPSDKSDSSSGSSASAWVGIDGDTCGSAILQTGIDFTYSGGRTTYDAWYEWYPDYAYDFSGITFSAGDSVTLTVTATSTTSGKAVITNNTKGKTVTHTFTGGVDGTLCETNAEWIVEDFEENGSLVPFADFGSVTFTGASYTKNGVKTSPSGATILDIQQSNKVLTSVSQSGSSITISHT